jgi:hypothetical protein
MEEWKSGLRHFLLSAVGRFKATKYLHKRASCIKDNMDRENDISDKSTYFWVQWIKASVGTMPH